MEHENGLFCFLSMCTYYGINADANHIIHKFNIENKVIDYIDIIKIAHYYEFKTKLIRNYRRKISKLPLPCIAQSKENEFFIIAKSNDEQVLILDYKTKKPIMKSISEVKEEWNGSVILLKSQKIEHRDIKFGLKWFIPTIIKYKTSLIETILALFTLQILGIFGPIMTQVIIDKALLHNSYSTLDVMVIGLLIIALFEMIIDIARNYIFTNTTNKIDVIIGSKLFEHLLSLPMRYFETRRVGDNIARIKELENVRRFLTGTPLTSLMDTLFIAVYIAVMLFYSLTLTFIVIASIPIFALLSLLATPIFRNRIEEKFNAGAESQSFLVETITGVNTVKALAIEPTMETKWKRLQAVFTKTSYRISIFAGNINTLAGFLQKVFDLLILWYGAHLVMKGDITVGALIAFRMLSSRVSGPVLRLVQLWQDYQQTSISIKRIGDIFDTKSEISNEQTKTRLPKIVGNIQFQNVIFRYKLDAPEVINNMSFTIPAGSIVGIVGRSGSGKSTITKLLQRLYIPQSGKIMIDGADISITDSSWLRRQTGVVLQDSFLFNLTVKENISINCPGIAIEKIVEVCKIAGAHDFILELPDGYDTMLGERGMGLSGGQKQRIAIARALIHNPKILIFDEATSALDYESESIIQKNLKSICRGRTVLIIAHRLSTLRDANYIMSVDKGKIVEAGTHEQLMNKKGLYSYLYNQQMRGEET